MPNLGAASTGMAKDANWRNNFEIPLARSRSDSRFLRSKEGPVMFRFVLRWYQPSNYSISTNHYKSNIFCFAWPTRDAPANGSYSPKLRLTINMSLLWFNNSHTRAESKQKLTTYINHASAHIRQSTPVLLPEWFDQALCASSAINLLHPPHHNPFPSFQHMGASLFSPEDINLPGEGKHSLIMFEIYIHI